MTDRSDRETEARLDARTDLELLSAVRAGDTGAYAALYHRHLDAALSRARRLGGGHDPQDVAQEAFLKILKAVLRGGGPQDGFAGYLMRAVRNEAIDRSRRAREIAVEDVESLDPTGSQTSDGADERIDRTMMQKALSSLPATWQQILWLTEVEGLPPREAAPQLQMSPNAVAQLSRRARRGLRTAWLQAHVDVASAQEGCRQTAAVLGAYERGQLGAVRAARVDAHLEGCLRCSAALAELRQISTGMRSLLLPVVLGSPLLLGTLSDTLAAAGAGLALATAQGVSGAGVSGGAAAGGSTAGTALWTKLALSLPSWSVVAGGSAMAVAGIVLMAQLPSTPRSSGTGSETGSVHAPVAAPTAPRPLPESAPRADPSTEGDPPLPPGGAATEPPTGAPAEEPGGTAPGASAEPLEVEIDGDGDGDGDGEAGADAGTEAGSVDSAPVPASQDPEAAQASPDPAPQPAPVSPPVLQPLPPSMSNPPPVPAPVPPQEPVVPEPTEEPTVEPDRTEAPEPTAQPTVEPVDPGPTEEPAVEPEPTEEPTVEPEPALAAPTIDFPVGGTRTVPLTLSGEGTPGGVVRVHDARDRVVGTSTVGEDGTWSVSPTPGTPDVPTRYRAAQEAEGTSSPSSAWTDEYTYLAPELLEPVNGSTIPVNYRYDGGSGAWMVMTFGTVEDQEHAVIIDGRRWDLPARSAGETARYLALLERGTHTIELAYVDPDTGRLGAIRAATLTVA
ncbi:sigma-70 family RNA polymerase sigma factor [Brachybacterium sp.]|uniref:sigma-70 family RNA polymerase sigma factor n=1 Tax=Brachybacterium sp. TaxID=1891286 RepID=UPI002ECFF4F4